MHQNPIVMVTHEPDIARFAQRVVQFRDGQIRSDEPVREPLFAEAVLRDWPAEAK
jgi:putative ABC transport system ATP-binding protein